VEVKRMLEKTKRRSRTTQIAVAIMTGGLIGVIGGGERTKKRPGTIHIVAAAIMSGLIAVMGYVGEATLGHVTFGVAVSLWPGQALFPIAGIWFGVWGILGAYIGNVIGCLAGNPLHLAFLISISTIFQTLIPAWAFRIFKADPRLKTSRDAWIFVVFGILVNNFVSMLIGPTVWWAFGVLPWRMLLLISMPGWFISGLIVTPIVAMPILKGVSAAVMKTRAYCRGWFS
jgi:hypothetical protein